MNVRAVSPRAFGTFGALGAVGAVLLGASALVAGALSAMAQPAPPAAQPSPTAPARLAQCVACHGAQGHSTVPLSPTLAGQPQVFLENTLILVREGLRPIPAMRGALDGVSDAEIVALAAHFSAQAVSAPPQARDAAAFQRGQALAARGLCGTCHLPNYAGQQQMPRLAGQREDYLVHSMRQFRDNQAEGRDTQMNGVLRGLGDGDLTDLAHYFAQLR